MSAELTWADVLFDVSVGPPIDVDDSAAEEAEARLLPAPAGALVAPLTMSVDRAPLRDLRVEHDLGACFRHTHAFFLRVHTCYFGHSQTAWRDFLRSIPSVRLLLFSRSFLLTAGYALRAHVIVVRVICRDYREHTERKQHAVT